MSDLDTLVGRLGMRFGVLAESNTHQLTVIAANGDIAVGDLFLMPCRRGHERFYIFRTTQYANVMNRTIDVGDVAREGRQIGGNRLLISDVSEDGPEHSGR